MLTTGERGMVTVADDVLATVQGPFSTILPDSPWRFENRSGKVAPEHHRLLRYPTMALLDEGVTNTAAGGERYPDIQ